MKKINLKLALAAVLLVMFSQLSAQAGDGGGGGDSNPNEISIYGDNPPPDYNPNNPNFWRVQSDPCIPQATSWVLGGNNMSPYAPLSNVGTCNNYPFILQANGRQSVFLLPNSYVGMGWNNYLPTAALDIRNTDQNGNPANETHFRVYGDQAGNLESTTDITMNFATGKTFNINEGTANSSTSLMTVINNATFSKPQAWVGRRPTSGNHTDFNFAAEKIVSKEVYVFITGNWMDFVFDKEYKLMPLKDVERFVKLNRHLPDIPAAGEIEGENNRLNLGEMQRLQMGKIEELYLHLINMEKEMDLLKQKNAALEEQLKKNTK